MGILNPPSIMATSGITILPSPLESIASNSLQYLLNLANLLRVSTIDLNFTIKSKTL